MRDLEGMSRMEHILEIENISKRYGDRPVLEDFSLAVRHNEYLSLLGPSGCGKSTLLRVIAGFERPDGGRLLLDGRPLGDMPAHERGIGFVSQGFALFPHMSVFDNVAFGLRYRLVEPIRDEREVRRRVEEVLDLVGLADLGGREIGEISGGQKQRVALARTLVADPGIILLDEPLGALDANLRARMTLELRRIRRQLGVTFVHVTGNEMEALAMGDRVVVMDSGRAIQVDDPDTIFNHPATPEVARFLNRYNMFAGSLATDGRFVQGEIAFACPGACPNASSRDDTPATYCIRFDRVEVGDAAAPLPPRHAGVLARFVASEYSGPRIAYFFRLREGQVLEVEHHLSSRRPEEFTAGEDYRLQWPVDAALVFA